MRTILPHALEAGVRVCGKTYRLRPTVWHVKQAMEALRNDELTPRHRMELAVWHLYRWPRPRDKEAALRAAWELLDEPSPYGKDPKSKQALDFDQDAAMLTAAFRQLYGIDLQRESLTMDWRTFLALVGGITSETRLGEIMDIRTRDLPKRTPTNGELIRDMMRAKAIYAIRQKTGQKKSFDEGLKSMVEALIAMAGGLPDEEGNQP